MRGKSRIVQVRLSEKLLNMMDEEIHEANQKTAARPWTRSAWVRHAVEMQLEISRQRRKSKGPKKYVCYTCGKKKSITEIAHSLTSLLGERQHFCKDCHPTQKNGNPNPPM